MKKILLSLGTIATIATPIAAVISCGVDSKNENTKTQTTKKEEVSNETSTEATSTDTTNIEETTTSTETVVENAVPANAEEPDSSSASVMKRALTTVCNTIDVEDISKVYLFKNGFTSDSLTSDYAAQFIFNKGVSFSIGGYLHTVKENTKITLIAKRTGTLKALIQDGEERSVHNVVGSQRLVILQMIKAAGLTFNDGVNIEAQHAEIPHVAAPVVEAPFSFDADIAKINKEGMLSSKDNVELLKATIVKRGNLTKGEIGIENLWLSEGTTISFDLVSTDQITKRYVFNTILRHGDKIHRISGITVISSDAPKNQPQPEQLQQPQPEVSQRPQASNTANQETHQMTDEEKINAFFGKDEHSVSKTTEQLNEMLSNYIDVDLMDDSMGLDLPNLDDVVQMKFAVMEPVEDEPGSFTAEVTFYTSESEFVDTILVNASDKPAKNLAPDQSTGDSGAFSFAADLAKIDVNGMQSYKSMRELMLEILKLQASRLDLGLTSLQLSEGTTMTFSDLNLATGGLTATAVLTHGELTHDIGRVLILAN